MKRVTHFQSRNDKGQEFVEYEDDIIMPSIMMPDPESRLAAIKNLSCNDSVIVATYQKSGTHWITNMVLRLLRKDENDDVSRWSFLEVSPLDVLETTIKDHLKVFTTHLYPKRMPDARENMKIVFVLRNPKDVAVSFYHHFKKVTRATNNQDWDEFLTSFMDGTVPWGSLMNFLRVWEIEIFERKEFQVGVFYYEDFIDDSIGNLKKMANFIGVNKTDDELANILEECSMDNLRARANQTTKGPKDKDGNSVIYRKGGIGDWKNHFTVAQNEVFDKYLEKNLSGSRFTFRYQ